MSFGAIIVFAAVPLIGAVDQPPTLEAHLVLWRCVPPKTEGWPGTVVLRNASGRPIEVALKKDVGGVYIVRETTPTGETTDHLTSEPFIDWDQNAIKYPKGFVPLEPEDVIALPIQLRAMPRVAHQSFEARISFYLVLHSEGKEEELTIRCKVGWSPDSEPEGACAIGPWTKENLE